MRCNCPNVVCRYYGNCAACVAHNRATDGLCHCMENAAQARGAKLPLRLPKTYLENDEEAMSLRSAELVCEVVRQKPDALISLPAGNTAIRTYEIFKEMADAGKVDFSRAHFVALDEWLDLEDESENCDAFMNRHFYGPLSIPADHITRFDIHSRDLDAAVKKMDDFIFSRGGIDVMLLGIGMNGHLGLNEPDSDFSLYSKVVELDPVTMRIGQKYFSNGMTLTRGITLGIRHMFDCGRVILQAAGAHKAEIIEKVYRTAPTQSLPATVLKLLAHGMIVLDRAAATNIMDLLNEKG